jgi:hypothetical protein
MPEVVLPDGPLQFPQEGPRRYPWDEWLDGEMHELVQGRDYEDVRVMRSAAYQRGRRDGLIVVTRPRGPGRIGLRAIPDIGC